MLEHVPHRHSASLGKRRECLQRPVAADRPDPLALAQVPAATLVHLDRADVEARGLRRRCEGPCTGADLDQVPGRDLVSQQRHAVGGGVHAMLVAPPQWLASGIEVVVVTLVVAAEILWRLGEEHRPTCLASRVFKARLGDLAVAVSRDERPSAHTGAKWARSSRRRLRGLCRGCRCRAHPGGERSERHRSRTPTTLEEPVVNG